MDRNDVRYNNYIDVLKEELIPAMGCTEPRMLAMLLTTECVRPTKK